MYKDQWKYSHILFPVPIVLVMGMTSVTLEIQNKRKKNDLCTHFQLKYSEYCIIKKAGFEHQGLKVLVRVDDPILHLILLTDISIFFFI